MAQLCNRSAEEVIDGLIENDLIYFDPIKNGYVETAEYLSGNVREKLRLAEIAAKENPTLERNVNALKNVIPVDIPATEISVRMGANWIDTEDYARFLNETCKLNIKGAYNGDVPPSLSRNDTLLNRSHNGEYKVKNARNDYNFSGVNATSVFGTSRMNVYEIFGNLLNSRDCIVRDKETYPDGKPYYVTNTKETYAAQEKAKVLTDKFQDWIFATPERREKYVRRYNETFNCLVGRKYDGSHQTFPGMSPDIHLREHQLNAISRAKYGGNSLFAHVVGAGKSFEFIAATMEKKRMNLISKACVKRNLKIYREKCVEFSRLFL